MDYKILSNLSYLVLETIVTGYLKNGYELAGGVSVVRDKYDCTLFSQAVVKK
jgi:hypothetical protein